MVYKRKGGKSLYFQALLKDGRRKQMCTYTTNRTLAGKIATMWEQLATEHRAWDLLQLVHEDALPIGRLYDLWVETKYSPLAIRRRVQDTDLAPLVEEWHQHHQRGVALDSAKHALAHVRALIPEGTPCPASTVDVRRLTRFLAEYEGKRNTVRKVHSSLSVFFAYVTKVHGAYTTSPMLEVDRPAEQTGPIRFHDLPEVERIVGAQPDEARRAYMALLYGTGMEVSVALGLTRGDFYPERREVRAAGTKAVTRDRVVRVAEWAWPIVWTFLKQFHPAAHPWLGWDRFMVSDWHRQTEKALKLPLHPLKNARHHWAVRALRDGRAPVAVVQAQLGHASPTLTLKVYGRFIPSGEDREAAEQAATSQEAERRKAGE